MKAKANMMGFVMHGLAASVMAGTAVIYIMSANSSLVTASGVFVSLAGGNIVAAVGYLAAYVKESR